MGDSVDNEKCKSNDDIILDQSLQEEFDTLLGNIFIHYGPTQHPHI